MTRRVLNVRVVLSAHDIIKLEDVELWRISYLNFVTPHDLDL